MSDSEAAKRDYLCYWATGHQLVHHGNPYDADAILRIQKSAGYTQNHPFYMRNPPTAFFLALPLGFVNAKHGAVLWSLAIIGCLMASIRMLWILNGRPEDRLHLVGYLFPPALACLLAGQTGIFLLFGFVLFLYLYYSSHPYGAGMALIVIALKPQIFLPVAVVLTAWTITAKTYRVLSGAAIALGSSLALSVFLDPAGWPHYLQMIKLEHISEEFVPTISLMFRIAISEKRAWLQFVPTFFGCRWALMYYWRNREHWSWINEAPILLLVSILVAPYAWFSDEVIVLPAILAGLYRSSNSGRSLIPYCCIAGIALVQVFANVGISSGFYLWTTLAWLLWYLYAIKPLAVTHAPSNRPFSTT